MNIVIDITAKVNSELACGHIRDISPVKEAAIHFTDDALKNFVKVPRPFLKTVLNGCVTWAKENGVTTITDKEVKVINDKRNAEKQARKN